MSFYRGLKKRKCRPNALRPVLESLEDRSVPAISLTGVPTWVERGPGPLLHGQTEGFLDAPVSGAIRAIAPDPTDANTVFIGSVNGGIWRTTNANAASPTWTPLIDDFPGLSIAAITISPRDSDTIFAGVGGSSSAGRRGSLTGLLKSTDGGNTWELVGRNLRGLNIRQVVASAAAGAEVVLVATSSGLFRSTNGGLTFTSVLTGSFTDLARDTGNTARFYAARTDTATSNGGIFRSEDGGATWTRIDPGFLGASTAINIKLAIHRQVGDDDPLYAGIVGANGQLSGVFRSPNRGENWTAAPLPGTTESGSFVGIHPGGQGGTHFSLAADPNDPDVVYVGGDRQPAIASSVGNVNFTGRLFKGDFTPPFLFPFWESITHFGASGTAPHADSRAMVFDANGNMLEGDDGGIFKLIHPEGSINPFDLRRWTPLNGNLRITELRTVAYDPVNHVIMGGTQDNGSVEMIGGIGSGDNRWTLTPLIDVFGLAIGLVGDGHIQAVDSVSAAPNVIRYSLGNNVNAFIRRTFNTAGDQVGITSPVLMAAAATPIVPQSGLLAPDTTQATAGFQPGIRYVLNSVNPARMLLGFNNLYESTNRGDTIAPVQLGAGLSLVSALAYGGRNTNGTTNPEVAYVARGATLALRTAAGGAFANVLTLTSSITDIVLDPTNFRTAYLLTSNGHITRLDNAGLASQATTDITGNLDDLEGVTNLQTIEIFRSTAGLRVILVGGRDGVYRTIDSDTEGTGASWHEFGAGLPNAPVTDIVFDPTDNRLVVSTLGRGAWTISNASTVLVTPAVLTVTGDSDAVGQNDSIGLIRNDDRPWMLDVFLNNISASPNLSVPLSALQRIVVSGLGGNDTLTVNSRNGPIAVPGGIEYDGGADALTSDTLSLFGGSAFTDLYQALPGNTGRSSIQFDTDSDFDGDTDLINQKVNTFGVDLVRDQVDLLGFFLDLDYTALNQSDTLTLQDDASPTLRVTSTRTAPVQFARKEGLLIRAGGQDDRINIVNTAGAFLLDNVTVNAGGGDDTINIESTVDDTTINGEAGADTVNVGREFGTLLRLVTLNDITSPLTFHGGLGTDTLNVTHTEIVDVTGQMDRVTSILPPFSPQTRITGLGMTDPILSDDVQNVNVNLGFANETMNVVSTLAGVNTSLRMGGGNDTVRVGGSTANDIRGALTIDAGAQLGDAVILQELEPAGTFNVGTLGNPASAAPGVGFLSGFGMGVAVNFSNTESVAIIEGPSNDFVNFAFASPPTFAFGLSLDGGTDGVVFRGSDKSDRIRVSRRVGPNGPEVIANINGQIITGGYSGGETVSVFAGDGNDHVEMDPSVTTWKAELFGEDGNDHLVGTAQDDRLEGGLGNDRLEGLAGDDVLVGGSGHDVFVGGDGTDQIDAGDGDNDVIFADLADLLVSVDPDDVIQRR
jgi:RTX calcium-binding nonapeptide repeat (4 copies)